MRIDEATFKAMPPELQALHDSNDVRKSFADHEFSIRHVKG